MRDFLEGACDFFVKAFEMVTSGIMVASPALIFTKYAIEEQSWLLGLLAFVTLIVSIGVAVAVKEAK